MREEPQDPLFACCMGGGDEGRREVNFKRGLFIIILAGQQQPSDQEASHAPGLADVDLHNPASCKLFTVGCYPDAAEARLLLEQIV